MGGRLIWHEMLGARTHYLEGIAAFAALACAAALLLAPGPAFAAEGADSASNGTAASSQNTSDSEEKIETPTVRKEVAEAAADGQQSWQAAADAAAGEWVSYRLTGTLPSNWAEFSTYYYEFADSMDASLEVDPASVRVALAAAAIGAASDAAATSTDLTAASAVTCEGNQLKVAIADLKAAAPDAAAGDTVVVTYRARLVPERITPGALSPANNYVALQYTSKPWTTALGRSVESRARLYTWSLCLSKADAAAGTALAGAAFTVQDAAGRYVAADGTLAESPVTHTTDANGSIVLAGIDSGTYTVTETAAPEGYTAAGPFTLTVRADVTADPVSLAGESDGANVTQVQADAATGTVTATVTNTADTPVPAPGETLISRLAQTGDAVGIAVMLALLAATATIAIVAHRRSRKQGKE